MSNATVQAQPARHSGPSPFAQPFALSAQYRANRRGEEAPAAPTEAFTQDLGVRLICRDCNVEPPNLVEEFASGDLVCGDCGLVIGDKIVDTRSEWRTFANEEGDDPSRVGQANNPLMDGLTEQLDTRIAHRDGGSGVSRDLQRALGRVGGTQNRNILDAFEDIQRKCDSIHLNRQVSETAKQLFKRVEIERILRGKRTDAIIAACIYVACKMANVPRTFPEICNLTNVSKKMIGQCYKEISQAFGLHRQMAAASSSGGGVAPTNAVDLVSRFSNHLALDQPTMRCVRDVAEQVRDVGLLAGSSPITVAAACIFMATTLMGLDVTPRAIGAAACVSEVTIRNSYRRLVESKDQILTTALLQKHPLVNVANLNDA